MEREAVTRQDFSLFDSIDARSAAPFFVMRRSRIPPADFQAIKPGLQGPIEIAPARRRLFHDFPPPACITTEAGRGRKIVRIARHLQ